MGAEDSVQFFFERLGLKRRGIVQYICLLRTFSTTELLLKLHTTIIA